MEELKEEAEEQKTYLLTPEQKEILGYSPLPSRIFKIMAFAGTGKTTTLIEYAKARPDKSFLYLAFNKSVQLEAVKKFGSNVSCRTAHALAYAKTGWEYREYLTARIRPYEIIQFLELDSGNYKLAAFVLTTFTNYLVSSSQSISMDHIPLDFYDIYDNDKVSTLINLTQRLIHEIRSGNYKKTGVTHDWYLKEYQLSGPHLKYNYILLDEAQDINPVIADIVLQQIKHEDPPAIIMVGDNHQQIYSFRGAKGILAKTEASKTMYLTQSFRFNDNIGKIASMLLECFKGEKNRIAGIKREDKPSWDDEKYTIICRTNAFLFDHAVKLIKKRKMGFVGPIEGYRFTLMNDISNLMYCKNDIKDNFIRNFTAYKELKDYALKANDVEITSMCTVVEKYGEILPYLIETILSEHLPCDQCQVTLTTAHKSKGLEWNNILISNDFVSLLKDNTILFLEKKDQDEINLLYVAITRAIHNLRLSPKNSLINFIKIYQKTYIETIAR